MLTRFNLTPTQALVCGCVFIATSIGAVLLAWGFARWNGRSCAAHTLYQGGGQLHQQARPRPYRKHSKEPSRWTLN